MQSKPSAPASLASAIARCTPATSPLITICPGLLKLAGTARPASAVACSQIDIGNAATPMTDRMVQGVLQPSGEMKPEPRMDAEHVGSAVAYMASLPLEANVLFMTVMATKMPFVGRG